MAKRGFKRAVCLTGILLAGFVVGHGPSQANAASVASQPEELASNSPAFEVASVKHSGPKQDELNGLYTYPGGTVIAKGCTLRYLIMVAFDAQSFQVSGGPSWMDDRQNAGFDIEAKPPATSRSAEANPAIPKLPPNDEQRQMLQTLLIERFGLKYHRSSKEGPVFVLTKGDKALKLEPSRDPHAFPWVGGISGGWFGGGIRGVNISMQELAARLSRFLERPVLDQTGITGSYDFEYRTGDEDNDTDKAGFLITAMKEIGLRLKSGTGPREAIVIDSAEKPTEN
jgi:uncharacterized protein (TIGR03435 family)